MPDPDCPKRKQCEDCRLYPGISPEIRSLKASFANQFMWHSILRKVTLIVQIVLTSHLFGSCGTEYRLDVITALEKTKEVRGAQEKYREIYGNGSYGRLEELARYQLISQDIADGENRNYRFELRVNGPEYQLRVVRIQREYDNDLSFFMDETGIIRASDQVNCPADKFSEPIGKQ